MAALTIDELRVMEQLAANLADCLDELNQKLTATADAMSSIRAAYATLPHPADLECLAAVTSRIVANLDGALERCESLPTPNEVEQLADGMERENR